MTYGIFTLKQALPDDWARLLTSLAGVKYDGKVTIRTPENAAFLVARTLMPTGLVAGFRFHPYEPIAFTSYDDLRPMMTELRDWVPDYLTDYQREGVLFAGPRSGSLLHHPTGSGKSLSAIVWSLLRPGPVVFVTRASVRVQMSREVVRFTLVEPYVCKPAAEIRKRDKFQSLDHYVAYCAEKGQRPYIIVGWEAMPDYAPGILQLAKPVSVIFDESHKGKGHRRWQTVPADQPLPTGGFKKTKDDGTEIAFAPVENIATAAARLSRAAVRRLATSATPVKNRVEDLWAQLDLLEPGAWGTRLQFVQRYCDARTNLYGGLDTSGVSNAEELVERLGNVAHRVDYLVTHAQLPAKRRESIYVTPMEQDKSGTGWAKEMVSAQKRGPTAVLEVRLAESAARKRRKAIERIETHVESGQKVVVFTGRRADCDRFAEAVRKAVGKEVTVWGAHGDASPEARQKIVDDYMEHPGPCVLVGTGDAFGESLNLQRTDAAFFVMLPYTPGQLEQWEGRFTRRGQDRPVIIYYVIAEGTVDEHVASILLNKIAGATRVANSGSLLGANEVIAGMEKPEEIVASILAKLADSPDDDDDD
jgi:hypothetical protein